MSVIYTYPLRQALVAPAADADFSNAPLSQSDLDAPCRKFSVVVDPVKDANDSWGVATLPTFPVLTKPENGAALNTQLLFGEGFQVLEIKSGTTWVKVKLIANGETGWIDVPYEAMSKDAFIEYNAESLGVLNQQLGILYSDHGPITVFLGSSLPMEAADRDSCFKIGKLQCQVNQELSLVDPSKEVGSRRLFVETALCFRNTAYCWGGRTIVASADCSGLAVVAGKFVGVQLPHSAHNMSKLVKKVEGGLPQATSGDLLFYGVPGEERVRHVAILVSFSGGTRRQALHESGCLQISNLDENGSYGNKNYELKGVGSLF